jgi:hypothetical protein
MTNSTVSNGEGKYLALEFGVAVAVRVAVKVPVFEDLESLELVAVVSLALDALTLASGDRVFNSPAILMDSTGKATVPVEVVILTVLLVPVTAA